MYAANEIYYRSFTLSKWILYTYMYRHVQNVYDVASFMKIIMCGSAKIFFFARGWGFRADMYFRYFYYVNLMFEFSKWGWGGGKWGRTPQPHPSESLLSRSEHAGFFLNLSAFRSVEKLPCAVCRSFTIFFFFDVSETNLD